MSDTAPGTASASSPALPLDVVPGPPADAKPKRATTREGRAAEAAARRAARGGTTKDTTKPKAAKPAAPRKATLETRLTSSLVTLGTAVAAAGMMTSPAVQADGVLICTHAPNVAAALSQVADNDPRVKAALERMLTAGTWSAVIGATLPLALGVMGNHGVIPAQVAAMLNPTAPAPAPEAQAPPMASGVPVV